MRSLRFVLLLAPLLVLLTQLFMPRSAQTLPLFARKYSLQCTQCHMAYPRLNSFGMKFKQRGYRLEGAKGESPWESPNFPLSLVGSVGFHTTSTSVDTGGADRVRLTTNQFEQNAVELHSAGTLAENVSFHFDSDFAGPGGPLGSGMAFVQLDDLAKGGVLNLKAGIFDADIPYLASSRSTTLHDYLAPVTLDAAGMELNGTSAGWTYAVGLINSERTTGKPGAKTLNNLENVYAWLMRDVNGQMVTARVLVDRQDPRKADANASQHLQADFSAFLNSGRWAMIPSYTYENFADADGILYDKIQGGLLEGVVLLDTTGKWVLTGRYELRHMPQHDVLVEQDNSLVTANLSFYVNPNARLALDWAHASDNIGGPRQDDVALFIHVGY